VHVPRDGRGLEIVLARYDRAPVPADAERPWADATIAA